MQRVIWGGVVAAALMAGASDAAAESNDFVNYCTAGALQTCASVQVETFWNGSFTEVTMRVQNLQGSSAEDNTGGSILTRIGLTAPATANIGTVSNFTVATSGLVGTQGNPTNDWQLGGNIGGKTVFSARTGAGSGNSKNGGILGCNYVGGVTRFFSTCQPDGSTGWVVFSFLTTGQWNASDAEIAWKMQSVGPRGVSLECRTEPDSDHPCTPTNVVPEPMSMVLLGTGLFGVGLAYRRRRRLSALEDGVNDAR